MWRKIEMSYSNENIQKASQVFFYLLKNKIVPINDTFGNEYIENLEVREIVKTMADEAGLLVFHIGGNVHLVSNPDNSIFATSYTHMKEKYKGLKKKKYFYLANIIICIFLSEVDKEKFVRIRVEEEGISYYKLEDIITKTIESWKKRNDEEENFSKDWALAIDDIYTLWTLELSHSKPSNSEELPFSKSIDTRLGFIHEALKPLKDEGLIVDMMKESRIIPKDELYERLNYLYHSQERYEEIMGLIEDTKEGF